MAGDLAEHAAIVEHGPGTLRRAVWGLLVGAALGGLAALVTARPDGTLLKVQRR